MKLRSVILHNYRKFQHAELQFPEGIVAIIGNNGSGKSTIIESIGWAIYGTVVARTTKEDIRRQGASPNDECYVTLQFELGGDHYEVTRIMSGSSLTPDAHVKVNGLVAASSASGVTRLLENTLGMNHDAFFTSLVARQKEINALSNKTAGERKRSMLQMLGIDAVEDAVRQVREDKKGKEQLIEALHNALRDPDELQQENQAAHENKAILEQQLKKIRGALASLKRQADELADKRTAMRNQQEQFNKLENEAGTLQERLSSTASRLAEKNAEFSALQEKKRQLTELTPQEKDLQVAQQLMDQLTEQRERFHTYQQLSEDVKNLEQQLQDKQQSIQQALDRLTTKADVASRVKRLTELEQNAMDEYKKIESAIKIKQVHIKTAQRRCEELRKTQSVLEHQGAESDCPTCGRPLEERYEDLLKNYQTDIAKEEKKIDGLQSEVAAFEAAIVSVQKQEEDAHRQRVTAEEEWEGLKKEAQRLTHLRETLKELMHNKQKKEQCIRELGDSSFNKKTFESVQEKVTRLQKVKETVIGLRSEVKRLPSIEEAMAELREKQVMLKKRKDTIEQTVQKLGFKKEQFEQVEQQHEEMRAKMQQMREQDIKLGKDLERAQETLTRLGKELAEQKQKRRKISDIRHEVQHLEMLAGGRDTGLLNDFKRYLISRIGPLLSHYGSSYFDVFTDGKYKQMEIDENYDIYIYDHGEKFGIRRFSGGEEDLANLSLRLAISQVIAERAGGVHFSFIVLDEIFGSQDSQRRTNVLHTLGELSHQFQQVILITHIEDIKDTMQHVIRTVEDEEGISHVIVE